jgi:hypothetical protein
MAGECRVGMTENADEERLRLLEAYAENAYSEMYDAGNLSGATACYGEAKEALHTAIGLARELGLDEVAERMSTRLAHIKAVFRSQFT